MMMLALLLKTHLVKMYCKLEAPKKTKGLQVICTKTVKKKVRMMIWEKGCQPRMMLTVPRLSQINSY
uniref:Uncharacterized protein n=1 Tax=Rhizophora mucronata TaxID=61149 RepID=A0A2P2R1K1_RHIMU